MHVALFSCTIVVVQCSHGSEYVVKWPSNGINDLQEEGCCFALFGDSTASPRIGVVCHLLGGNVVHKTAWTVLKMPIPKWRTVRYGNAFFLQRKGAF